MTERGMLSALDAFILAALILIGALAVIVVVTGIIDLVLAVAP